MENCQCVLFAKIVFLTSIAAYLIFRGSRLSTKFSHDKDARPGQKKLLPDSGGIEKCLDQRYKEGLLSIGEKISPWYKYKRSQLSKEIPGSLRGLRGTHITFHWYHILNFYIYQFFSFPILYSVSKYKSMWWFTVDLIFN